MGRPRQLRRTKDENYEYVITVTPPNPPAYNLALPTRAEALTERDRLLKEHPDLKVSKPKRQKARNVIA